LMLRRVPGLNLRIERRTVVPLGGGHHGHVESLRHRASTLGSALVNAPDLIPDACHGSVTAARSAEGACLGVGCSSLFTLNPFLA